MLTSHQDRVAVVTGAARGIGQAVCRQLGERGSHRSGRRPHRPAETLAQLERVGHKATRLVADVSDPEQTQAVGDEVRQRYGRCNILGFTLRYGIGRGSGASFYKGIDQSR